MKTWLAWMLLQPATYSALFLASGTRAAPPKVHKPRCFTVPNGLTPFPARNLEPAR